MWYAKQLSWSYSVYWNIHIAEPLTDAHFVRVNCRGYLYLFQTTTLRERVVFIFDKYDSLLR